MWKDAYLESCVLSADPLELIRILYQGALDSVHDARQYLTNQDIAARSQAISKASEILAELDASLNHQTGGSISRGLADLYGYMRMRLLEANLQQSDTILAEVQLLLVTLLEAWKGIQKAPDSRADALDVAAADAHPMAAFGAAFEAETASGCATHSWSA